MCLLCKYFADLTTLRSLRIEKKCLGLYKWALNAVINILWYKERGRFDMQKKHIQIRKHCEDVSRLEWHGHKSMNFSNSQSMEEMFSFLELPQGVQPCK